MQITSLHAYSSQKIKPIMVVFAALLLGACSKDGGDDGPDPDTSKPYALVTRTDAGNMNAFNFYVQTFPSLSGQESFSNREAVEIVSAGMSGIYPFNGSIYANLYSPTVSIVKWTPNASGQVHNEGSINVAELDFQSNICFKDANTAFVGGPGVSKILIFNPTTMQKTGYIDFSAFSRLGETTHFPNPGDKINMEGVAEMVIRDNYLFVGVFMVSDFQQSIPATTTADVLVVDLRKVDPSSPTNADAVVKWISSDKGSTVGSWNSGTGSNFMVKDEKGDIYLLCHNFWGYQGGLTQKPAGVIRIENGETDFDPNYYFDLEAAALGKGNAVMNLEYAGNGIFFCTANDNAAIDPDNPYSYYMDPIAKWFKGDLYARTLRPVNDLYTKGSWASVIYAEGGKAYLPYVTAHEEYFMEVDIQTLASKKLFTTQGVPAVYKLK